MLAQHRCKQFPCENMLHPCQFTFRVGAQKVCAIPQRHQPSVITIFHNAYGNICKPLQIIACGIQLNHVPLRRNGLRNRNSRKVEITMSQNVPVK